MAVEAMRAMEILDPASGPLIASYCMSWSDLVAERRVIEENGTTTTNSQGIRRSIALDLYEAAFARMIKVSLELGLSPTSMARAVKIVKPSRRKSNEKIDGIVALAMAVGRVMGEPAPTRSFYETEGLFVLLYWR